MCITNKSFGEHTAQMKGWLRGGQKVFNKYDCVSKIGQS